MFLSNSSLAKRKEDKRVVCTYSFVFVSFHSISVSILGFITCLYSNDFALAGDPRSDQKIVIEDVRLNNNNNIM